MHNNHGHYSPVHQNAFENNHKINPLNSALNQEGFQRICLPGPVEPRRRRRRYGWTTWLVVANRELGCGGGGVVLLFVSQPKGVRWGGGKVTENEIRPRRSLSVAHITNWSARLPQMVGHSLGMEGSWQKVQSHKH